MFNNNDNNNKKMPEILNDNNVLKQVIFFGFYLVFFIILILLLRNGYKNNKTDTTKKNTGYNYDYNLNRVMSQNYHFTYTEKINDTTTIYDGDLIDNTMSYRKSGNISTEYYQNKEDVYVKDLNTLTWQKTETPISFSKLTNPTTLKHLITRSNYFSKIDYIGTTTKAFTYQLSSSLIYETLTGETKELDTPDNEIIVKIEKNGAIKSIELNLTNYYQSLNPEIKSYSLLLTYSKFGQIEEIANPIS